jgi:hypothetical protein
MKRKEVLLNYFSPEDLRIKKLYEILGRIHDERLESWRENSNLGLQPFVDEPTQRQDLAVDAVCCEPLSGENSR